jgi:hypothetical protein
LDAQIRTENFWNPGTSTIIAAAFEIDGDVVTVDSREANPVLVNGEPTPIESGESVAVGDGAVFREGNDYYVVFPGPDGEVDDGDTRFRMQVNRWGTPYLDLHASLDGDAYDGVSGLLGNANGDGSDDLQTRFGEVVGHDAIHDEYAESWRIRSERQSLFPHDEGRSVHDFNQPKHPDGDGISFSELDPTRRELGSDLAKEHCFEPGTEQFKAVVIDWALTGDNTIFDQRCAAMADEN